MTVFVFRPSFAPHPLNEDRKSRAARLAEEVRRSTSSAPHLATAGEIARAFIEAAALGAFVTAVLLWAAVLTGTL